MCRNYVKHFLVSFFKYFGLMDTLEDKFTVIVLLTGLISWIVHLTDRSCLILDNTSDLFLNFARGSVRGPTYLIVSQEVFIGNELFARLLIYYRSVVHWSFNTISHTLQIFNIILLILFALRIVCFHVTLDATLFVLASWLIRCIYLIEYKGSRIAIILIFLRK